VWTATLPGGENTGLLAAGASTTVTVLVQVPEDVSQGDSDVTVLNVTSDLDHTVYALSSVTTTAILRYYIHLPIITK